MFQAGIENVVASSGTSLTVEQIRQIKRFTKNITILYDGDSAGIKASFRGIDLILEEDMNVKVLLFPDGEDPDSFSKKVNGIELKEFITKNTKDFITFKTDLLLSETNNDPIKKSELIRNIVETIAIIPDGISRSVYIKECSRLLAVSENVLLNELNKIRRTKINKQIKSDTPENSELPASLLPGELHLAEQQFVEDLEQYEERDLIRLLLNFGEKELNFEHFNEELQEKQIYTLSVAATICNAIAENELVFESPVYKKILDEFMNHHTQSAIPSLQQFINNEDSEIQNVTATLVSSPYELSKHWEEKHQITVVSEERQLKVAVVSAINTLLNKHILFLIKQNQDQIKVSENEDELIELLTAQRTLHEAKQTISAQLGRIILR
jgi:DNA primase